MLMTSGCYGQIGIAGYVDPATTHNQLLKESTADGVYKLIGPYKVVGSSYLFGEKNYGSVYSPQESASHIRISYNTYNQEVEFLSGDNNSKLLVKSPGTVDSFIFEANHGLGFDEPLKFVYGSTINSGDKYFYKVIYEGPRYSVYKRYKSDLGYVSSNYVQSELRQFDLGYEYYYRDSEKKGLKKLRQNAASVIGELKAIKDITPVFTEEDYNINPEEALRKAFVYLNQ
jgi:hypothetical protein